MEHLIEISDTWHGDPVTEARHFGGGAELSGDMSLSATLFSGLRRAKAIRKVKLLRDGLGKAAIRRAAGPAPSNVQFPAGRDDAGRLS